jgi:hypothetical protein
MKGARRFIDFENRVLRFFGPKRIAVRRDRRKLPNKTLHMLGNLQKYYSNYQIKYDKMDRACSLTGGK